MKRERDMERDVQVEFYKKNPLSASNLDSTDSRVQSYKENLVRKSNPIGYSKPFN